MKDLICIILKDLAGKAPAEFQVLPEGKIEVTGDEPVYLDETAAGQVIAAFKARGNDMVIDYEHQTLADGQSPAAGWVKDLIWKGSEGLWAVVEWTKKAKDYLENREYRYFSPVMFYGKSDRVVRVLVNVALTNSPAMNNLKPLVAKAGANHYSPQQSDRTGESLFAPTKEVSMDKVKQLLGLAADVAEAKVEEALTLLVNKARDLETQAVGLVACKEVLESLGAKADAGKDEVVRLVASLKAPGDVAVQLSHEVATLKTELAAMKQTDLVQLALKEGKTSPDELAKWGQDLALKNPEQFKLIVLSRPAGSVIPVDGIVIAKDKGDGALDDTQKQVNRMMGVDDATFQKYNK